MRLFSFALPFLAIVALAACGDSNSKTTDGPPGCTGHTCTPDAPPGGVNIMSNEGGNIIFEYIYFDTQLQQAFQLPMGTTTANRVMAYFMDSMTPQKGMLPVGGQCNNLVTTMGWPEFVGSPHTDLDIGNLTITGKNTAGSDVTISVPKQPAGKDEIGRMHDIFYQTVNPDASQYELPDSSYDVHFSGGTTGSVTIPQTDFTGGIFLSNTFQVSSPNLEDDGPLVGGTDYTVHWTPSTSTNLPSGDDVNVVTWLVDVTGAPTHMCPTMASAGMMTIPGSAINEYKQIATSRGLDATHVILLRNAIVHHIKQLPNNEPNNPRRIDMLSVMCWAQLMNVQ